MIPVVEILSHSWGRRLRGNVIGYEACKSVIFYQACKNVIGYHACKNVIGYQACTNVIGYQACENVIGYQACKKQNLLLENKRILQTNSTIFETVNFC